MEKAGRKKVLRILHLEDNPDDRQLVADTLRLDGLDCKLTFTQTEAEFESALKGEKFDLVMSDFTLPSYDGVSALAATKKLQSETPFIFLSGTIGEERAVEMLKSGATDCVLKDNLQRLVPALRRALAEAGEKSKRRAAEDALKLLAGQLRALAGRLQSTREEERLRISREIHDELGEALTSQKLGLMWIRQRLNSLEQADTLGPVFEKIDFLRSSVDGTAGRVRRLCTELRPPILDDLGLPAAIEWQAREFQSRTNIPCEIIENVEDLELEGQAAVAIFRIFQEILTNVARHANASRVTVKVKVQAGAFLLEVSDNGRGISPEKMNGDGSLGLVGMRERLLLLGGSLQLQGTPGRGTIVTVNVPLQIKNQNRPAAVSKGNSK
jgi:signal transduction histidine kinase